MRGFLVLLPAGLLVAALGAYLLIRPEPRHLSPTVTVPLAHPAPTGRPLAPARPVSLEIARIGVKTKLMTLAKNPDGTLEVPPLSRVMDAGWYRLGPSPGQVGPAVIAGHVDSRNGPGVFYRLADLRPGDTVRITRKDGSRLSFQVDTVERVPKDRFPTTRVYGMTDFPALRLITCGGTFDKTSGHYRDNLIAYAHLTGFHG